LWPEFLLYGAITLLTLSIVITFLRALSPPKVEEESPKSPDEIVQTIHRECASCRWKGDLARHNKVCPRCGQSNFIE